MTVDTRNLPAVAAPLTFSQIRDLFVTIPGSRFRRLSWSERKFIYLVDGSTFKVSRPPLNAIFPEGTNIQYSPHIDVCWYSTNEAKEYVANCAVWHATNDDLLATDWEMFQEDTRSRIL